MSGLDARRAEWDGTVTTRLVPAIGTHSVRPDAASSDGVVCLVDRLRGPGLACDSGVGALQRRAVDEESKHAQGAVRGEEVRRRRHRRGRHGARGRVATGRSGRRRPSSRDLGRGHSVADRTERSARGRLRQGGRLLRRRVRDGGTRGSRVHPDGPREQVPPRLDDTGLADGHLLGVRHRGPDTASGRARTRGRECVRPELQEAPRQAPREPSRAAPQGLQGPGDHERVAPGHHDGRPDR